MKRGCLVLLICALAVPVHAADSFEDGMDAFLRGDYSRAQAAWQPLAETGHAQSAFNLGRMYELGQGVTADDGRAAGWFREAAERGHPEAQRSLGQIYAEGRGGLDDPIEAWLWLSLAARQSPAGSPGARMLQLQLDAVTRRLDAAKRAEAQSRLEAWVLRRD